MWQNACPVAGSLLLPGWKLKHLPPMWVWFFFFLRCKNRVVACTGGLWSSKWSMLISSHKLMSVLCFQQCFHWFYLMFVICPMCSSWAKGRKWTRSVRALWNWNVWILFSVSHQSCGKSSSSKNPNTTPWMLSISTVWGNALGISLKHTKCK